MTRRLCRNYPRCPATTTDASGYCDDCRPAAQAQAEARAKARASRYDDRRGTRSERGYDAAWYAPGGPREMALRSTGGLCADCLERGQGVTATEVHHLDGNPRHNVEPDGSTPNLRPLCKACHDRRHGGRYRRQSPGDVVIPGCGPDGMPLDPRHPCYGRETILK